MHRLYCSIESVYEMGIHTTLTNTICLPFDVKIFSIIIVRMYVIIIRNHKMYTIAFVRKVCQSVSILFITTPEYDSVVIHISKILSCSPNACLQSG